MHEHAARRRAGEAACQRDRTHPVDPVERRARAHAGLREDRPDGAGCRPAGLQERRIDGRGDVDPSALDLDGADVAAAADCHRDGPRLERDRSRSSLAAHTDARRPGHPAVKRRAFAERAVREPVGDDNRSRARHHALAVRPPQRHAPPSLTPGLIALGHDQRGGLGEEDATGFLGRRGQRRVERMPRHREARREPDDGCARMLMKAKRMHAGCAESADTVIEPRAREGRAQRRGLSEQGAAGLDGRGREGLVERVTRDRESGRQIERRGPPALVHAQRVHARGAQRAHARSQAGALERATGGHSGIRRTPCAWGTPAVRRAAPTTPRAPAGWPRARQRGPRR